MARPPRLPQRRYTIALAFALAALLAAGAYAIVHEFVIGKPAPKDVSREIEHIVGRTVSVSVVPGNLRAELDGEPRVAAVAQTSWGTMYLVVAPLRGGGECRFRVLPGDRALGPASEVLGGGADCTTPRSEERRVGKERRRGW